MPDSILERHQDYVLDLGNCFDGTEHEQNNAIGTLAANKVYPGNVLTLDPDAPFVLRGLAARMRWDLEEGQNLLNQIYFRLKRATTVYTSNDWLPLSKLAPAFGLGGNPYPWWPHENYPASGTIEIDIWNNGDEEIPGFQMVYRGVKLYTAQPSLYPNKFRAQNFTRSVKVTGIGYTGATAILNRFLLKEVVDADFVLRHIQAGAVYNGETTPGDFFPARNVWLTLRDAADKPFSNAPVDWYILAGQGTVNLGSAGIQNSAQFGPFHPGLFYPEIYIPKYTAYSLDIFRDDSAYVGQTGLGDARIDLALGGIKVFPQ